MAFDSICLRAVLDELREPLTGAKIDKIQQPSQDTLIFTVRCRQGTNRLLVNTGASAPRIQFTQSTRENPAQPPMFCMLLRKYLTGARILDVTQPGGDRVAALSLLCTDELGDAAHRTLIVELMGRYSNVLLLDADGLIVDCQRRVDAEMSPVRQLLPGLIYRAPSLQNKLTLDQSDAQTVARTLDALEGAPERFLLDRFAWLSPAVCRELVCRYGDKPASLARGVTALRETVNAGDWGAYLFTERRRGDNGRETVVPVDYSWLPMTQYGSVREMTRCASFSSLLDDFYAAREAAQQLRQRSQGIRRVLSGAHERIAKKLAAQRQELAAAADRDRERRQGDLIMGSLWTLQKGQTKAWVVDYTAESCPTVEITLDAQLTPQENAQRHYKRYARAKHAEEMLTGLIAAGERELDYLESVSEALERASGEAELSMLRSELAANGYASQKWAASGKKQRDRSLPPYRYVSAAGLTILAGRNNTQNEQLTLHTAARTDWWFHVQRAHGAHVILVCEGKAPDDASMNEAAAIAVRHSAASQSRNVPVDYTQARYVKKQPDGKTGMVLYVNYKTAIVSNDPEKEQTT